KRPAGAFASAWRDRASPGLLCCLPEFFHLVERGRLQGFAPLGQRPFDGMEAIAELVVGAAQRILRLDAQMAAEIDHRKDEIAEFVLDLVLASRLHRLAQFPDLLLNLVEDRLRLRPVEADARRLLLQLERAYQAGQGKRNAVEITLAVLFGI